MDMAREVALELLALDGHQHAGPELGPLWMVLILGKN